MKKSLIVFMTFLTAVSSLISPFENMSEKYISVSAENTKFTWDNIYYNFSSDNTIIISGCTEGTKTLIIPDEINGIMVTAIDDYAFQNCGNLEYVEISSNVKTIGKKAFEGCKNLKSITIPENVEHIGDYALGYYNDGIKECLISDFTIICYMGTAGENYVNENGIYNSVTKPHTHIFTVVETIPAKCEKEGKIIKKCTVGSCLEKTVEIIPALEHNYRLEETFAPTTESEGFSVYKCTLCGDMKKDDFLPKLKKTDTENQEKNNTVSLISLKKIIVSNVADRIYNGSQYRSVIKVYDGDKRLVRNKDYTVEYGKNIIGKGTVTVKGIGKYTDKVVKTFKINPRKTTIKLKSANKSKITATITKKTEANYYQIAFSSDSGFKNAKIYTQKSLKKSLKAKSGKTYYFKVRTIYKTGTSKYISEWSGYKKIKVK